MAAEADFSAAQQVVVFEPADAWRAWLLRALAAQPRNATRVFDSAQALITALHVEHVDLLLVPFRVRDLDGTGWLQALHASPGCAQARVIAGVAPDDVQGASMARLSGAHQVYRKVVDAPHLAAALGQVPGSHVVPHAAPPRWQLLQDMTRAAPLFEPSAIGQGGVPDAQDGRALVFDFLATLACHAEALDQFYSLPPAEAQRTLEAFAEAACLAGAWRVAQHADLMLTVLMVGGRLHPALAGAYAGLLADTERELALWLLEGPAPTAGPVSGPGGAH